MEVGAMVEAITYKAAAQKFGCGDTYTNLTVVNFSGPGGVKASAYCCNMNIDMDGEPHAYGPPLDPKIKPIENLWNGGWLDTAQNLAKKNIYEAAKKAFEELEKKKADLVVKAKASATPAPATPDPAVADLDKQLKTARDAMVKAAVFWHDDPAKRPVNFGKIFWHWYGPVALSPAEARSKSFVEMVGDQKVLRRPQLDDQKSYLEDVNGRYPVIQSVYEPGTGYYVSAFPRRVNTAFPDWDQRSFMPAGSTAQVPNAALSTVLEKASSLHLNDMVLGLRLDSGASLAFPFLDRGFKPKVGECSIGAFVGLGGVVADNPNRSQNDWLVLYLAFAQSAGQSADAMLTRFASAANADDFPVMLAFVAQTTLDAKNARKKAVPGDPVKDFERWKKSQGTAAPAALPSTFATVDQSLRNAGFSPFAQRVLKKHPGLVPQGPFLRAP
jgi:hypothetical protein